MIFIQQTWIKRLIVNIILPKDSQSRYKFSLAHMYHSHLKQTELSILSTALKN